MMKKKELKLGTVVKSMAGHDAGRFYIIIKLSKDRAYIADGKLRKLEKPKAKNVAHLSSTNNIINLSNCETNKSLREFLSKFNSG